jgi:hypothetical protein
MTKAGGNCSSNPKGGYFCTNVNAAKYKAAANCASSQSGSK